jgi:hypothetical protein
VSTPTDAYVAPEAGRPDERTLKIVVTDTIEYEVEIDLADPRWSHLREFSDDPDEWVAALDDEAGQPDSDLGALVKQTTPTDAWREVNHV